MRGRGAAMVLAVALTAPAAAGTPELPIPGPTTSPSRLALAPDSDCTVVGTDGDDDLQGTEGPDVVCGLGGSDRLRGLGGADDLRGGPGDDVLVGGAGDDRLSGDEGIDTASFEEAPAGVAVDLAAGSASGDGADALLGIERVVGSAFGDALHGTAGPDVLEGGGEVDLIYGREGDDVLLGGDGDDFLVGEAGADTLDGGLGANVCHPLPDAGVETGCWGPQPRDPRDVRGPLDVVRVRTRLQRPRPVWKVQTRRPWSTERIWDEGYVAILLDTRGGPEPDHYAVARSTGGAVTASLYRVRPDARDRAMRGGVRAWRTSARSITIRVVLGRVGLDPLRPYYRWGVQSLSTGRRCQLVCMDPVGFPGALFPEPTA